jgi:Asp-tRNA(Asn)/Glu-tRNA(Gln) amidotransferase A subunit family amidase
MVTRRSFILGSLGAGLLPTKPGPLVTLSDWLNADRTRRRAELPACLERISATDSSIHAWVQVLPQPGSGHGVLADIPFGVKDVIETKGLATEYGSPIYAGRKGTTDAAIVQSLRRRGGVLMGKTHTAAFAYRDPPPTANPRDTTRTPGGSSSGSAAAVAAGMVPLAVGTQTSGSTIRPASYCGITGFKPSYGRLATSGVLLYAKSLDTLGFFTHSAADMLSLWDSLGESTGRDEDVSIATPSPLPEVEPEMAAAFQRTLELLRKGGVQIQTIALASLLTALADAQHVVAIYEGARAHQQRFMRYGEQLGQVANMVREGLQISVDRYSDAKRVIAQCRSQLLRLYASTPVILVPAATGPAPKGLNYTGDSSMNTPWTAAGTPAISIPMPVGDGLPLGLQLTAAPGDDARVLRQALRLSRLFGS